MAKQSGIYAIVNKVNFKVYIGSAVNLDGRRRDHFSGLERGDHRNSKLQNSYNKHGKDNFVFDILEVVEDKTMLLEREQFWLDFSNSAKIGYNIASIARSRLGVKQSRESVEKMRKSLTGRKLSESHRKSMSESRKGRILSEQGKRNIAEGIRKSEKAAAQRERLFQAKIGVARSEETKAKISESLKGKKFSEERRQSLRDAWARRKSKQSENKQEKESDQS